MSEVSLYHPGQTIIHQLNPFTKLLLALCLPMTGFLSATPTLPLILLAVGFVLLAVAKEARDASRIILRFGLMLTVLFVVQSFFHPGADSPIWSIGPLQIKVHGFMFAALISLRFLTMLSCFYLLMSTTHPSDLVFNLERRGLSPKIAYVILATLQSVGEMQGRAKTIRDVQMCRGVPMEGNLMVRAKAYLPLIGPLVIGSVLNIETRALALEVRGFGSTAKKSFLEEIREAPWERGVRYALLSLPVLQLIVRLVW
jgi:energy-coupling factor transport system permease protein